MEETNESYTPRKLEFGAWEEWFAWRPVKVNGRRVWLERVFRRCINTYVDMDDWKRWEYGTLLDVLANSNAQTRPMNTITPPLAPFKGQQDG